MKKLNIGYVGLVVLVLLFFIGVVASALSQKQSNNLDKPQKEIISGEKSEVHLVGKSGIATTTPEKQSITISGCRKIVIKYEDCDWDTNNNGVHDDEEKFWKSFK
jgi:hypothetical protein